jgi:hypothetical protein
MNREQEITETENNTLFSEEKSTFCQIDRTSGRVMNGQNHEKGIEKGRKTVKMTKSEGETKKSEKKVEKPFEFAIIRP